MGIGELRCHVIDVEDLRVGETFWSELTGKPIIFSPWPDRFSYLGQAEPWRHEVILQKTKTSKGEQANRTHIDIWVDDIDKAVAQIEAIGGQVKKPPSIFARPHSKHDAKPIIDWAVMQDPFGNEFCLVSMLTREERHAVQAAGEAGDGDDHHWRVAAGRTTP